MIDCIIGCCESCKTFGALRHGAEYVECFLSLMADAVGKREGVLVVMF
ncbi:MAG: hypothetical protein R3E73_10845 [Porticoccaceae bacterium]|nr:hypothetical protein [Pseudomonadales bacterium]MCP5171137.1 hypothetical protein [Pseudomonadales bacterium]